MKAALCAVGVALALVGAPAGSEAASAAAGPDPREWADSALASALSDTALAVRRQAYEEAGRRRFAPAVGLVLRRLQEEKLPDGRAYMAAEAYAMIRMLGSAGDTSAFGALAEFTRYPDLATRVEAVRALGDLSDKRGAEVLRVMARPPCAKIPYPLLQSLAFSLGKLGDSTDAPLFHRWARACPRIRNEALEGLGLTSGLEEMRRGIREALGPHPKKRLAQELHLLDLAVQHMLLEREGKL